MHDMTQITLPTLLLAAEAASLRADTLGEALAFITRERDGRPREIVAAVEPFVAQLDAQRAAARAEENLFTTWIDAALVELAERGDAFLAHIRRAPQPAWVTPVCPEGQAFARIFDLCGGEMTLPGLDGDALYGSPPASMPEAATFTDEAAEVLRAYAAWDTYIRAAWKPGARDALPPHPERRAHAAVEALLAADAREAAEAAAAETGEPEQPWDGKLPRPTPDDGRGWQ